MTALISAIEQRGDAVDRDQIVTDNLTKSEKAYYYAFVASCCVCLSPFKALAYFAPFLFIFVMAMMSTGLKSILLRWILYCGGVVAILVFYTIVYSDFVFTNALLAAITYSSIIPLLVVPAKNVSSLRLIRKLSRLSLSLFIFEGAFGILQALYGASRNGGFGADNGDYVEGTIHIGLVADRSFGNPIFVYNMVFLGLSSVIFLLLFAEKRRYAVALGFVTIILASVLHLIIYFTASVIATIFLSYFSLRKSTRETQQRIIPYLEKGLIFLMIFAGGVMLAIGDNVEQIPGFVTKISEGNIAKAEITLSALYDIPQEEPLFPYIGLGPGQFSSRASLIASGFYLKNNGLFEKSRARALTDKYMYSLLLRERDEEYVGSTTWPWYSWLSVYSEFGLVGMLAVISLFGGMIRRLLRGLRRSYEKAIIGIASVIGLFFMILSALQENYWELTHGIFLGILVIRIYYFYVTSETTASPGGSAIPVSAA